MFFKSFVGRVYTKSNNKKRDFDMSGASWSGEIAAAVAPGFPTPFVGIVGMAAVFCGFLVGLSKAGLPGAGIVVVPIMAGIMPARESVGFLLPILIVGDVFAIVYWRRHVDWRQLFRLFPCTFLGVGGGYFALRAITSRQLLPVIGAIVLSMIALKWWNSARAEKGIEIPRSLWLASVTGTVAGATSMMANAAGPIIVIYLLSMGMEKRNLIGTSAWFFFVLNLFKTPFGGNLDLITMESLKANCLFVPVILIGGICGVFLAQRIPQKQFNLVVELIAAGTALCLCVKGLM